VKAIYSISLLAAAVAPLAFSMPAYAAKTDSRIESSAQQSYVFVTYLKGDAIKIKSTDGAVVLTGTVNESFHKSLAQETVAGLPGVKSVDNRLETRDAAPQANSDEWLRDKVKVTLSFHRSVSALTTEVDVKDGVVTLRGEAAHKEQKELTTEYTRDVEGVKSVTNEMTVSKSSKKHQTIGEKIDDSSITAQVKLTLLYHRSTSALNTSVKTMSGVVTLTGTAGTVAEKDLAAKFAGDVKGVKEVKNLLSVE
jgi:osmotically-inducible protein OsmY